MSMTVNTYVNEFSICIMNSMKFDRTRTPFTQAPTRARVVSGCVWTTYTYTPEAGLEEKKGRGPLVVLEAGNTATEEPPKIYPLPDVRFFVFLILLRFQRARLKLAKLEAMKKRVKPLLEWVLSPRPVVLRTCPPVSSVAPPSGLVLTAKAFASFRQRGKHDPTTHTARSIFCGGITQRIRAY
jgi:hypothetical protein